MSPSALVVVTDNCRVTKDLVTPCDGVDFRIR
jgi:hypothetical protein